MAAGRVLVEADAGRTVGLPNNGVGAGGNSSGQRRCVFAKIQIFLNDSHRAVLTASEAPVIACRDNGSSSTVDAPLANMMSGRAHRKKVSVPIGSPPIPYVGIPWAV
jgi:hypothetical protein